MSLEQEVDYNSIIEMGKRFDFFNVKPRKKGPDYSEGIAVNLPIESIDVYIPVKRRFFLPDGNFVINFSNKPFEIYFPVFMNENDFRAKIELFEELTGEFEKVYKPYHDSLCAKVEGGRMVPGAKVTFPTQSETETAEKEFLAKVAELKEKYEGRF